VRIIRKKKELIPFVISRDSLYLMLTRIFYTTGEEVDADSGAAAAALACFLAWILL
jgi:hypothetical protein